MKFHLPSFLIGFVAGAGAKALAPRIRPLALELMTVGYKLARGFMTQAARRREDFEDLAAEAKARARGETPAASPAIN
jgi:hypothetical protein